MHRPSRRLSRCARRASRMWAISAINGERPHHDARSPPTTWIATVDEPSALAGLSSGTLHSAPVAGHLIAYHMGGAAEQEGLRAWDGVGRGPTAR